MTQYLPDNLLTLFAARPPVEFKPPADELLVNRKRPPMQGVAEYVKLFEPPGEIPPKPVVETKKEKKERLRREKQELMSYKLEQGIAMWAPAENPNATEDPYKTLYVSRINYETSESKLRREFERYGKIHKIVMPHDKYGKPRGYAFIEYSHKSEMTAAYKKGDGMKIDGRRVVVDYERGRTQKKWLPRRLGGGKGDTRRTRLSKAELAAESSARQENGRSPERAYQGGGGGYRSGGYSGGSSRDYGGGSGGYDRSSRDRGDRDRGDRDRDRDSRHRSDSRDRDRDRDRGERGERGERGSGGGDRDRERHGSDHGRDGGDGRHRR